MISKAPVYNLNAVLKETGLKADVLRAWERRYELPKPQRSQGGHRLYSDYDIALVKWLRARQSEGLSISRAVDLWREIIARGRDPLEEFEPAALPASEPRAFMDTRIEMIRSQWLQACMDFDGHKAEEILNQAFALYPVETVVTEVLQRGLSRIGSMWFEGKASVQQEHFTSALAVRRVEALILAAPSPTRQQSVLIACPAGELHVFPVLLLNLLLRRRGLKVIYLGADVPMEQMQETLAVIRPSIIVLAVQHLVSAAALSSWVEALRGQNIPLAYGGLIFNRLPGLRDRISAWFLGESLEQAINQVERLVVRPETYPQAVTIPEALRETARLYREKRSLIELDFLDHLQPESLPVEHIGEINDYFGSRLAAALELGDPAFLEADLEWISWLLARRQLPVDPLKSYLSLYHQAVRNVLGTDGAAITSWLETYTARL